MNSPLLHSLKARSRCLHLISWSSQRSFSYRRSLNDHWARGPQGAFAQHTKFRSLHPIFSRHESTQSGSDGRHSKGPFTEEEKMNMPNLRHKGQDDPRDVPRPEANERGEVPAYELTFTCKPCKTRSAHRISKHGYHNGTVLITCPECKNRHVISDHLKIFNDDSKSFEQILREKAELLKTGTLDPDGDFEMWDDGTQTVRQKDAKGIPQAGQIAAT